MHKIINSIGPFQGHPKSASKFEVQIINFQKSLEKIKMR